MGWYQGVGIKIYCQKSLSLAVDFVTNPVESNPSHLMSFENIFILMSLIIYFYIVKNIIILI